MTELKFGVRTDAKGDMNAASKKDVIKLQASVMNANSKKNFSEDLKTKFEKAITASANTKESVAFGAAFAGELKEQIDREGFMRSIFVQAEAVQNAPIQLEVRQKSAIAVIATGSGEVRSQRLQDKFLYPAEFSITFSAYMQKADLARTTSDRLSKLYDEGLEAIMVQEDRTALKAIDRVIADSNEEVRATSEFGPKDFAAGLTHIADLGGAPVTGLLSYSVWNDIIAGDSFAQFFNPIANMEIVKTGRIGQLYGLNLLTDATRTGTMRVLAPNTAYILNTPDMLGAYTDRYGIESAEFNGINQIGASTSTRGWNMEELMSMSVFNDKGAYKIMKV